MKGFILGCDVSKKDIHVCLLDSESGKVKGSHVFPNNTDGIVDMDDWANKKTKRQPYSAVMEATGVYHENMVDILYGMGVTLYIANAKTVKHYIASHNRRYKNDSSDAFMIASFGTAIGTGINEINIHQWEPFSEFYQELRSYSRQILGLRKTLTQLKNRMEALSFSARTPHTIKKGTQEIIETIEDTIVAYRQKMKSIMESDNEFKERVENIVSVKGLGWETVLHILCATDGFSAISNARQLTAYAGLDIPEEQSGRCRKPGHISKAGNSSIRQVLYMPAMQAGAKSDGIFHDFYQRLFLRSGGKGKGKKPIVAVMRKMLTLIYVLWRDNCKYDAKHIWKKSDIQRPELLLSST